jgi:hypothetical protein
MVRKLLARHVADTAQDHYLEFRELTTVDDIRRHLAMRYEVYSAAPNLRHLLPHYSRKRLDIDAYDTQSRFFGIFSVGPDGSEQIGGLRLIGTTHDEAQVAIVFLASQDDALRARAAKPTPYAIELPEKWPEPEALTSLLDLIRTRGEGVVEASRLVVTATHRGRSLGVGQVVLGLYESATTYVLEVVDTENVLQHCAQSHQAAAVRMGFRIAEGTTPLWSRRAQQYYVVLHGRGSHLTEPARERIRTIGRGVRARGAACRCPALQDCIGSAYASGDFSATDVFCPRLAQEVLVLPTGPMRAPEEGVIST